MGDPVSLIMTALVAGAAKTAGEAVSDGYKGLKDLIKRKFEEKKQPPFVQGMLDANQEQLEDQGNQKFLKETLVAVEADKDEEIIKKAKELQELLEAANSQQSTSQNTFTSTFTGEKQAIQQGNSNNQSVTM